MKPRILGFLALALSGVSRSAMAPSKMYRRILAFVIVPVLALSNQAHAALEEVTFQAGVVDASVFPIGGHEIGFLSGHFFFDTSQVTGGLRPVFQHPGVPPGGPGTVSAFFGAGPSGAETLTLNNGSSFTVPLTSGFNLGGDYESMFCGENFDDCGYTVGQVLTLNAFNAAADPWSSIFNGMTGSFSEFFPYVTVGDFVLEGNGNFQVHSVPEPATLSLLVLGLAGIGLISRRNKKLSAI